MRLLLSALALSLSLHGSAYAAASAGIELYFGQEPPGDTPVVFAPGIVSLEGRFEQFLLYAPDGSEVLYSVTDATWSAFTLEVMRYEDGAWTEPARAPFLGASPDALVAAFTRDMSRVFFTSMRPAGRPPCNVWASERRGPEWSEPTIVGPPVSSDGDEFEVAVSANGTLYFSSRRNGGYGGLDLYRARPVDGRYPEIENLGPVVNSAATDDLPWIAPDESYLVFGSDREGGAGKHDLYVTFRRDGGWTAPLGLGPAINTEAFDSYPSVSPDGRYLFFTRRTAWMTEEDSDIYWVGTAVIDRLRAQAFEESRAGHRP